MKKSSGRPAGGPLKKFSAGGGPSGGGRPRNGKRHGRWKFYYLNGKLE